ncbi:hypothetical protein KVR01_005846 [Diaporthe batatas]|uniref:uncharacterized protein n=1 Tax=Diaporthe batatas TaxID=748121 RepID=UPI001D0463C3|nr:uncharacterized protein KVR01_005846 [Diaporthe batatas]KAG8163928.1 hypothetical protein KVR01_005846 [Diaporthe batatas]
MYIRCKSHAASKAFMSTIPRYLNEPLTTRVVSYTSYHDTQFKIESTRSRDLQSHTPFSKMGFQSPSNILHLPSDQRLSELVKFIRGDTNLNEEQLPGLADLLDDGEEQRLLNRFVIDAEPASSVGQDFHIGLSSGAIEMVDGLDSQLDNFIHSEQPTARGHSPAGGHCDQLANEAKSPADEVQNWISSQPDFAIYDDSDHKQKVPVFFNKEFEGGRHSAENVPQITCFPTTSYGVQEIVKHAKAFDLNVRAAGYGHSWSPMLGRQAQIMISISDDHKAPVPPNTSCLSVSEQGESPTELNTITFQGPPRAGWSRLVRVGAAVTNEQLRRWCNAQKGKLASTMPMNVSMGDITLGGSNATISHGAGRIHPTLSDLVHTIEYIDVNGSIQKLSKDTDPEGMKAASGCFGLLGIVTHITFELNPMAYAVMRPQKLHITEAIPPPPEIRIDQLPPGLRPETHMTEEQRAKAQAAFEDKARNKFHAEWFWFPYTSKVWVNCWSITDDPEGEVEYPRDAQVILQWFQTVLARILQVSQAVQYLQHRLPWAQVTLMSTFSFYGMPDITDQQPAVKTKLPNALHFSRASPSIGGLDTEMEIPLLPMSGIPLSETRFRNEIDFSNVQRAWWAAILTAYKYQDTCPQRLPLSMRITGPSQVIMAPYRGHTLGSACIGIQTLENMRGRLWQDYAQEVLDHWMNLKDSRGEYLTTRPHWAKDWYSFKVRGQPMIDYVRQSYAREIKEFVFRLGQIAKKQGWSMDEARRRFGNDALDVLFSTRHLTPLGTGVRSQAHKQERSFITTIPVIIIN